MQLSDITEFLSAIYVLATLVGHMPFMPASVQAFCNRIALNLKDIKDAK